MPSSSKYASVEDGYEFDEHDKKVAAVSIHPIESHEDLKPILPQQAPAPLLHPEWHTAQPDSLGEEPFWEFFMTAYDLFLCFIAFVLLLKTSLVIYAWHKDKENYGYSLDNVSNLTLKLLSFNEQVVTAFTIVFITIMSTVTRRLALYKAQQGAYISDLEQLQASVSLPSVIKMVFYLRKFTKFSFMLVGFWCFYYLGSQAAKREYAYAPSDPFKDMQAAYPNSNGTTIYEQDYYEARFAPTSDLITAITTTYAQNSKYGVDAFGQFLLPNPEDLYALKRDGTVNNTKEYKTVPSRTTYSTYVGLPFSTSYTYPASGGDPASTSWYDYPILGDFNLKTTYLKIYCDSMSLFPFESFPSGVLPTMMTAFNMTNGTGSGPKQLEIWQRWDESFIQYFPDPIPANATKRGSLKLTCNIVQPQVQVGVHCSETACLVNKISCPPTDPTALHNTRFNNASFASIFFNSMLLAGGIPPTLNDTSSNKVVSDMGLYNLLFYYTGYYSNDTRVDDDLLNPSNYWYERVINTWYNLGMRNWPVNETDLNPERGFTTLTFHGAQTRPHYAIYWYWIGIDYFSGILLLAAAIYSFWLRKRTLAPDIFGFVSSLTRDNPHFPIPPGGSTLDGIERTRALRSMKVRIGDVNGHQGEIGRIGFIPVRPDIQATHLSKERKYM